jgi:hypothetical protein
MMKMRLESNLKKAKYLALVKLPISKLLLPKMELQMNRIFIKIQKRLLRKPSINL